VTLFSASNAESFVISVAELLFESGHFFRDKPPLDRGFRGFGGDPWPFFQRSPVQCRAEPFQGNFPVAVLRPGFGRLDDDAGREVPYPYPGVGGVAMLAARS